MRATGGVESTTRSSERDPAGVGGGRSVPARRRGSRTRPPWRRFEQPPTCASSSSAPRAPRSASSPRAAAEEAEHLVQLGDLFGTRMPSSTAYSGSSTPPWVRARHLVRALQEGSSGLACSPMARTRGRKRAPKNDDERCSSRRTRASAGGRPPVRSPVSRSAPVSTPLMKRARAPFRPAREKASGRLDQTDFEGKIVPDQPRAFGARFRR